MKWLCIKTKTRNKMENQKRTNWGEIEELFATEVITQSQRNARKWFIAWAVTATAMFVSNLLWAIWVG